MGYKQIKNPINRWNNKQGTISTSQIIKVQTKRAHSLSNLKFKKLETLKPGFIVSNGYFYISGGKMTC